MARESRSSDISDMDKETLAARVRERADAVGIKPVALARAIDKGRDYVLDLLNGRKATITNDILTPLAAALECDERYFTDVAFDRPGRPRRAASPEQLERYDSAATHGAHLWAWREFKNLSLKELADEAKMTPGTVSDLEQGVTPPTAEQLQTLADALGTRPGSLRHNPFRTSERVARLISLTEDLDPSDQTALIDMAEALERRRVA